MQRGSEAAITSGSLPGVSGSSPGPAPYQVVPALTTKVSFGKGYAGLYGVAEPLTDWYCLVTSDPR